MIVVFGTFFCGCLLFAIQFAESAHPIVTVVRRGLAMILAIAGCSSVVLTPVLSLRTSKPWWLKLSRAGLVVALQLAAGLIGFALSFDSPFS